MKYTADQFAADLKEPYAWPGGYPRYFVCSDGAAIAFKTAHEQRWQIRLAIRTNDNYSGWQVVACAINWEDPDLYCDHTGERIESAYAEDKVAQ
jgi:hypothetical protein